MALIAVPYIFINYKDFTTVQLILLISLVTLFLHQFEEYRYPGYFPGMLNSSVYESDLPDRYPINTQTSLVINVYLGWIFYFLAVVLANRYIWLGIGTMLISLGNFFAHTFFFNIKGKTWYNPGMATAIVLFLPVSLWFVKVLLSTHLATSKDWIAGIVIGALLNFFAIIKPIDWMANRATPFIFKNRQLRPADRSREL